MLRSKKECAVETDILEPLATLPLIDLFWQIIKHFFRKFGYKKETDFLFNPGENRWSEAETLISNHYGCSAFI